MMQISAELIKARRHRMLRALLVVMVLVELLIIGGMRYWATHAPDPDADSDNDPTQVRASTSFPGVILPTLTFSATFGTIFAVIFASRFGGEEYSFGTAKQLMSMGVNRSRYVLRKILSATFISGVFIVIPVVAASAFTIVVSALTGEPLLSEPVTLSLISQIMKGLGIAWVCLGFYSGLAVFLAIATRQSQTATTIAILMILLEANIVNSFAEKFSVIRRVTPYSIGRCANIAASLIERNEEVLEIISTRDITNAFITLGVWFALFSVCAIWIFRKQELGVDRV